MKSARIHILLGKEESREEEDDDDDDEEEDGGDDDYNPSIDQYALLSSSSLLFIWQGTRHSSPGTGKGGYMVYLVGDTLNCGLSWDCRIIHFQPIQKRSIC